MPIAHQFICIESTLFFIEFESFQDDIESQFIAEFETIGNCLFLAIDENSHSIDFVFFYAGIVGFLGKSMDGNGGEINSGGLRPSFKCDGNLMRNLGCEVVERKCRNKAYYGFGNSKGYRYEIRV